jgi:hypothetical protein
MTYTPLLTLGRRREGREERGRAERREGGASE